MKMQWFIDMIKDWVIAQAYATMAWVLGYCPKARATLSFLQSIPNETYTKINFNVETYDTHLLFADYKFTAAVAGYYLVALNTQILGPVADKTFTAYIYKNGMPEAGAFVHSSNTAMLGAMAVDLVHLEAEEFIEGFCFHNFGVARSLMYGTNNTYISISQIF